MLAVAAGRTTGPIRVRHSNRVRRTKGMRRGTPTQRQGRNHSSSYLSTGQVADLLYVSPKTVSRWAKEGKLPFMRTLGGHRRYPEAEIRELAEKLREEPTV
jgi:excisionase family DNA binding protein